MKRKIQKISMLLISGALLLNTSCKSDEPEEAKPKAESRVYSIALAVGSGSSSPTYVQGHTEYLDASKTITFSGYGFEVPASRTARIFTSGDGTSLFDLDYGGGRVYKYDVYGGETYKQLAETNVEYAIGTTHPRWTKINEDVALLHNISSENVEDETVTGGVKKVATARIMSINLANLSFGKVEEFEVPVSGESGTDYVFRIDAPVVVGNKVYYGLGRRGFDPLDPASSSVVATNANVETMVLDYPSLTNPKLITTKTGGAKGSTNGYRGPVCHVDENSDIYQVVSTLSNEDDTYILKITNGDYDEAYSFNLSTTLGEAVYCNTWFYVGNGIGYLPYLRANEGSSSESVWSVARIDVRAKTAVKLNLPSNLWLQQFQNGVMIDGKFHMPITSKGGSGNVYIFDPTSTSPDGFTKGAKLETGADAYYIGIY